MQKAESILEEGDKKRQHIEEESSTQGEDHKHQQTRIISVQHEVVKINGNSQKRSNDEQEERITKSAKNCK
eukprot:539013-Heterocapsa_arctica.AAC.1